MSISVLCANCKARFTVSDQFAGKKGPCPKCKKIITVPEIAADEVKIHVPEEFAGGGKDKQGRPVLRPERRKIVRLTVVQWAMVAGGIVGLTLAGLAVRWLGLATNLFAVAPGLVLVTPLLVFAAYTFLREEELEPYRGVPLLVRCLLCSLGYLILWGMYLELVEYDVLTGESFQWLVVGPIFVACGGAIALASLDLPYGSAIFHYLFYLGVGLYLRWLAGMPPIWQINP